MPFIFVVVVVVVVVVFVHLVYDCLNGQVAICKQ